MLKLTYDVKQPAFINHVVCDVVIERTVNLESEVTSHPVEDGFSVSDHVTRKPITLNMTAFFTPTPVTFFSEIGNNQNRLAEVFTALHEIYRRGEPITIRTTDAIFYDMVMTHAPLPRNVRDGLAYSAQLSFVQVRRVFQKTEALPNAEADGKNGETELDAGYSSQTEIGTGIKVIYNTATTEINTLAISQPQSGDITTGNEQKAKVAADSVHESLSPETAATNGAKVIYPNHTVRAFTSSQIKTGMLEVFLEGLIAQGYTIASTNIDSAGVKYYYLKNPKKEYTKIVYPNGATINFLKSAVDSGQLERQLNQLKGQGYEVASTDNENGTTYYYLKKPSEGNVKVVYPNGSNRIFLKSDVDNGILDQFLNQLKGQGYEIASDNTDESGMTYYFLKEKSE